MRPTTLAVRGLKSWADRELELEPLTAIVGPNGSGKTALLQAIRLALLGHDPEVGKRLQETRKLVDQARGEAEIGLTFDTGFAIRRRFGAKTETQVVPSLGESTESACQARIDEETGGLVVTLHLAEFLELSDEKRRAWLFEHLPRDEVGLDWPTFSSWTDAEEGPLGAVVRKLWDDTVTRAPNQVAGLSAAIEVAHRDFLDADRRAQDHVRVVERHEERLRQADEPAEVDDAELAKLEETIAALNQRIGEARAGKEAREELESRLARAISRAKDADLAVAMKREELAGLQEPPKVDEEEIDLPAYRLDVEAKRAEQAKAEEAERDAHRRLGEAKAELRAEAARYSLLEEYGACPLAEHGCSTDTSAVQEAALELVRARVGEARASLEARHEEHQRAEEVLAKVTGEVVFLVEVVTATERAVSRDADRKLAASNARARLAEAEERLKLYQEEAEGLAAELDALAAAEPQRELYEQRDTAERERTLLHERKAYAARLQTFAELLEDERAELEDRRARAASLKELDGNLRRLRAHVIERMAEPLAAAARTVLAGIDPAKTFAFIFERENRSTFDFGFVEDGTFRSFDAASKGERALLAVAFVAGLLEVLRPPLRLLVVDDIEQLDFARRMGLLAALATLSERFDCVVVAGAIEPDEAFFELAGWHLEALPLRVPVAKGDAA